MEKLAVFASLRSHASSSCRVSWNGTKPNANHPVTSILGMECAMCVPSRVSSPLWSKEFINWRLPIFDCRLNFNFRVLVETLRDRGSVEDLDSLFSHFTLLVENPTNRQLAIGNLKLNYVTYSPASPRAAISKFGHCPRSPSPYWETVR